MWDLRKGISTSDFSFELILSSIAVNHTLSRLKPVFGYSVSAFRFQTLDLVIWQLILCRQIYVLCRLIVRYNYVVLIWFLFVSDHKDTFSAIYTFYIYGWWMNNAFNTSAYPHPPWCSKRVQGNTSWALCRIYINQYETLCNTLI